MVKTKSRWHWAYQPPGEPTFFWSSIGWFRTLIWWYAMATVLVVVVCAITWRSLGVPVLMQTVFWPCYWITFRLLRRRMQRYVTSLDFLVCLNCGYNLRGLEADRCPECGTSARAEEVKQTWRRWVEQSGRKAGVKQA
jgi:hypothetical protein